MPFCKEVPCSSRDPRSGRSGACSRCSPRPLPALAQSTASLRGTVTDEQGAALPGAKILRAQPGDRRGADDRVRRGRRVPDRRARPSASTASRSGPTDSRRRSSPTSRLEVAQTVGPERPAGRRQPDRGGERRRGGAGHRERHHVGRPGHRPAHRAGDPAQRPPLRRPRAAHPGLGGAAAEPASSPRRCAARARSRSTPRATAKTPSTS